MHADQLRDVLTDPVAQRLYDSVDLARLAYSAKDGSPRVIPIGYRWNGTGFNLYTAPNAPKLDALRHDPRVALTIDTESFPPNVLLVRGTATIQIIDGVPDEYLDMNRRHTDPATYAEWEAGVRGLYKQMALIQITPTWAKVLDFQTRLPSAIEELISQQNPGS
ncbi:MAG TPA: pyridoxamine 5'-phosphate oxidase family protein [Thermomicrobiales bacterium]|nr:pyridoxamine 5'-phosphate oxidase family protein [Thermomicrobiales bacterium]